MKNCAIATRNAVIGALYRNILKPVLFLIDAEKIHESFIRIGSILGATGFGRACTRALFGYKDRTLEQDILNIHFNNPIGLAAGFDYEGRLTNIMGSVGMGFSTVGTITNLPYGGNPKPRLSLLRSIRNPSEVEPMITDAPVWSATRIWPVATLESL